MASGPLRQMMGVLGLLALTPTMALVATRQLAPYDAALRAAVTLAVIVVLGRLVAVGMGYVARMVEERAEPSLAAAHDRRAADDRA